MNIFVLDLDPEIAASYLNDKHVVKMAVETAQLLSSAARLNGHHEDWLYKMWHKNNPLVIWTYSSQANYDWLCAHGMQICREYTNRYGKTHGSEAVIRKLKGIKVNKTSISTELTQFYLAMPDKYKTVDKVDSYRRFYISEKASFSTWKQPSVKPSWFIA